MYRGTRYPPRATYRIIARSVVNRFDHAVHAGEIITQCGITILLECGWTTRETTERLTRAALIYDAYSLFQGVLSGRFWKCILSTSLCASSRVSHSVGWLGTSLLRPQISHWPDSSASGAQFARGLNTIRVQTSYKPTLIVEILIALWLICIGVCSMPTMVENAWCVPPFTPGAQSGPHRLGSALPRPAISERTYRLKH